MQRESQVYCFCRKSSPKRTVLQYKVQRQELRIVRNITTSSVPAQCVTQSTSLKRAKRVNRNVSQRAFCSASKSLIAFILCFFFLVFTYLTAPLWQDGTYGSSCSSFRVELWQELTLSTICCVCHPFLCQELPTCIELAAPSNTYKYLRF